MKLKGLLIKEFKNLRDLSVDFDDKQLVNVVIGRNGAGKSNLLEALVIIFRDMDLGKPPSFAYSLEYECSGSEIEVLADPEEVKKYQMLISVDRVILSYRQFLSSSYRKYLPSNVFGYYSGPGDRLEQHFEKHQDNFYKALLKGAESLPLRPLFYARSIHSLFVLMAFFIKQDRGLKKFLKDFLCIEGLESILFEMRQPPWKNKEGDPRFWYAKGAVQTFLDRLYGIALAPIKTKRRVPVDFRRNSTKEFLYLFIKDIKKLEELNSMYENPIDFFKALESTYISELISDVRIRVKMRQMDGSLTFRELSEGEQQLLTVLGLLRFTQEEESLFLLDEPDTHLNPAWSREYIQLLKKFVGRQKSSHIILATHDPLVLGELTREQVLIINRDEKTMQVDCDHPEEDPKGMGYAGILTSDMYGLRSTLDSGTIKELDQQRTLATKDKLTEKEEFKLSKLTKVLDSKGFTKIFSDPTYALFADALSKSEEDISLKKTVLSKKDKDHQTSLAKRIIQELKSEGRIK